MRAYLGESPFDPRRMARFLVLAGLGLLMLILVAPGCGRSSLEPETLDGGAVANCGPATCPNGCCDSTGVCRTGRDVRACGSVGGRCSDCVANGFNVCTNARVCGRDDPSCSSRTCLGCCGVDEGRLRCLSGTEPSACGRAGDECSDCTLEGRTCDGSTRACGTSRCDASNCDGCCVGDKCLPGEVASACGSKGAQCDSCAAGQVCTVMSGGGGRCEGTTACGPQNCAGCCNAAGQCVAGNDTTACGIKGQQCDACGANETCSATGSCVPQPACGPGNCTGCCVNDQCVVATTPIACGTNGQVCKACGPGQVCDPLGNCVAGSGCNPATCPTGCCVGDICAVGSQPNACGTGGALCQNCANQGRVCQSGTCQLPACGPATCPNGCCDGNTCVNGTQDDACGPKGGGACNDCTASNQICRNSQCVVKCGPGTCNGCCKPDNTCEPGNRNDTCGQGGAACDNCNATGSFCNGLVAPRRCNDDQSSCPAAYGSCAPGTTMPITPQLQNLCTDANLDTLAVPCDGGAESAACVAAVAALPAACRTCLAPFNHPFEQNTGLFACAASFVSNGCRRTMGCSTDCAETSCSQCLPTAKNSCMTLVTTPGGQCRTLFNTSCANDALSSGLCSRFSYTGYGGWLRDVGDQFCGNGL
ncbi:MAG: hypothetical protein K0S65_1692 [Labilithrix sp.]|nr:hypothetical protein [Labilithrix sp.]